jgi:diguanylate cyclase (GGDEF)-like protein
MVATVIVGMLCAHLLCFAVMFQLISLRLQGNKLGTNVFATGNVLLGTAYLLQLAGGPPGWNAVSVINHSLTLCAPMVFWIGAARFFGRPTALWRPLLALMVSYTVAQALAHWLWGSVGRYAMLSFASAVLFFVMSATLAYAARSFAKDLVIEMVLFAVLIAALAALNAAKFVSILSEGLAALDMANRQQMVFYLYMSFMATVLAPAMVWLVLRRLTEELTAMAVRDPLTQLFNRRGLTDGLKAHFRTRSAGPAHLLLVDIDHFKSINDNHGHAVGDTVLCHVARLLQSSSRQGDLMARIGGEEFVAICMNTDITGALQAAERIRTMIERSEVMPEGERPSIRCTVTVGASHALTRPDDLDRAMQEADAALYWGKAAGRNRVELSAAPSEASGGAQKSPSVP